MSATKTTRTRLVMAGALVGALILLSLSMLFSWPVSVTRASSNPPDEALLAFDSPDGTCLDWPADNPRALRRLDCAEPHLFEVTSNIDVGGEYGPDIPPPDERQWQAIANEKCTPGVTAYLGGKLDPFGKYQVSALKPTDEQWRSGDRKVRCGVHRVSAAGTRLPTKGSAAEQDQSNIFEPGTCLALTEQKGIGDPVDCAQVHSVEIVGNVDLGAAFPAEFPSPDAQNAKLSELCNQAAAQYSGGKNLADQKLIVTWDRLQQESWTAGSRKVDCKVGSTLPDGSGLAQVSGSIRATTSSAAPPPSTPGR